VAEQTGHAAVNSSITAPRQESRYVFGHSAAEVQRLTTQGEVLRPTTERLLRAAGVGQGARVLDVGCGAGDVSILAAELVGPTGSVVGIDRNADVIAVANERARNAGHRNVTFRHAALEAFTDEASFDCVVDRYLLGHQADPVDCLRASAGFLRPQGVIAVHEPDASIRLFNSSPVVPSWNAVGDLLWAAMLQSLPRRDVGVRMAEHFVNAGLPSPAIFREILVSTGEHSLFCRWMAESLGILQPQLVEMGIFPTEAVDVERVESKLRSAAVAARTTLEGPVQVGAWARV